MPVTKMASELMIFSFIVDDAALDNINDWKHSFSHLPQERCGDCMQVMHIIGRVTIAERGL